MDMNLNPTMREQQQKMAWLRPELQELGVDEETRHSWYGHASDGVGFEEPYFRKPARWTSCC